MLGGFIGFLRKLLVQDTFANIIHASGRPIRFFFLKKVPAEFEKRRHTFPLVDPQVAVYFSVFYTSAGLLKAQTAVIP